MSDERLISFLKKYDQVPQASSNEKSLLSAEINRHQKQVKYWWPSLIAASLGLLLIVSSQERYNPKVIDDDLAGFIVESHEYFDEGASTPGEDYLLLL